jgi:hypothetical protein
MKFEKLDAKNLNNFKEDTAIIARRKKLFI